MARPGVVTDERRDDVFAMLEKAAVDCGFTWHRDGTTVLVIERNPMRQWRVKMRGATLLDVESVVNDEADSTLALTPTRFVERLLLVRDSDREARRVQREGQHD